MTRLIAAASVLFTLYVGVSPATAQSLGVRGGLNVSTIVITPEEELGLDVSGKAGLVAGAFVTFRDASKLGFEIAGQFSLRRVAFGPDITDTITYLEAPVVARYSLFSRGTTRVRGLAGAVAGFRLTAEESVMGDTSPATDAYKPIDIGIVVGAQAELSTRWSVEGRYQFGLSEVYEVTVGGLKSRQRGFQILVGYRLR